MRQHERSSTTLIAQPLVQSLQCGDRPPPAEWESRRLYVGEAGARNWIDIASRSAYSLGDKNAFDLSRNHAAAVEGLSVRTMISLGAGRSDLPVVEQLKTRSRDLSYVPVDISGPLLELAIEEMEKHVRVPIALLCDFEQSFALMQQAIREHCERPVLLSLLGGTLGNLDMGETSFFNGLAGVMREGDALLLDVPLAGSAWTAATDPRLRKSQYPQEFKKFLTQAFSESWTSSDVAITEDEVEERIECSVEDGGEIRRTKTVTLCDGNEERVVLRFRRYDWDSVIDWLSGLNLKMHFHRNSIRSHEDKFGMGVVLVGR